MMSRVSMLVAVFLAFLASCSAFIANTGASRTLMKAGATRLKMQLPEMVANLAPAASTAMTTLPVSLEVTFAAYLAVLLGTFLPVTFLIVLYSQSEARKAGARGEK